MNSHLLLRLHAALFIALVLTTTAHTQNAVPAPRQKQAVALIGGTVFTVSGETLSGGTVVFNDGKITAVGMRVDIPPDAERIDVSGKNIYPGLIDAYNIIGLTEIGGGAAGTVDQSETGEINPSVHAEVAFHPESEHIPVARSGGVTVAAVVPQGGLISGLSAAMMLEGWTWEEMTLKPNLALVVNWPDMVYLPSPFSRQTKEDWSKRRDADLSAIRETFENARAYMKAKEAQSQRGSRFHETDPSMEAMIPVLQGSVPVLVTAYGIPEMQAAVSFADEQHIRLILAGAYDAWRIAPLLKEKNIPVILLNVQNARRRWEPYDAIFSLAKKFMDAGLSYCITGSRSASDTRNLPHHAAHASAYGLPRDEALRAITLFPARILGIDDRVGSLEVGKNADLFIADGDILEISSRVEQVFIRGRKVDMRDKHIRLYEKYKEKYRQLGDPQ